MPSCSLAPRPVHTSYRPRPAPTGRGFCVYTGLRVSATRSLPCLPSQARTIRAAPGVAWPCLPCPAPPGLAAPCHSAPADPGRATRSRDLPNRTTPAVPSDARTGRFGAGLGVPCRACPVLPSRDAPIQALPGQAAPAQPRRIERCRAEPVLACRAMPVLARPGVAEPAAPSLDLQRRALPRPTGPSLPRLPCRVASRHF
jgi:hypothetical protein